MKIVRVTPENSVAYYNLAQAYEAEFSAITGKLTDSQGKFALDTEPGDDVIAYLCIDGASPIGLAAVQGDVTGYQMCEFYVIPSRRGKQTGTRFTHLIWDRHAGPWQIKQIAGAEYASLFWRKAIRSYRGMDFEEDQLDDSYWGLVTRQRFVVIHGEARACVLS